MRKTLMTITLLVLSISANAQSTDWTTKDTIMQAAVTTSLVIDWHQTRQAMADPQRYREMNPLIGHRARAVNQYFAGAIIGSAALAYVLPQPWRERVQAGQIGMELIVIGHNKALGLRVAF